MKLITFVLLALILFGCVEQEPEILAQPYNATLECWEEMQPTGKFAPQGECNNAVYYVVDEDKQIWMLLNSCGKDEFTPLSGGEFADAEPCDESTP